MRAIRSQFDDLGDQYSLDSGIVFPVDEDFTRQEFKNESDINLMLARHGVFPPAHEPLVFGENDFDIDLTGAMAAVRSAEEQFEGLPEHVRSRFSSWQELGAYLARLDEKDVSGVAAAAAASYSGSAATGVPPVGDDSGAPARSAT